MTGLSNNANKVSLGKERKQTSSDRSAIEFEERTSECKEGSWAAEKVSGSIAAILLFAASRVPSLCMRPDGKLSSLMSSLSVKSSVSYWSFEKEENRGQ